MKYLKTGKILLIVFGSTQIILLLILFALNFFPNLKPKQDSASASTNYYVSQSGSDSNPGSQSLPFRTISKAVSSANAGSTIYVVGGTYNEKVVLSKSGTSNAKITLKNFDNSPVIIDAQNTRDKVIWVTGQYIVIDGFTLKNSPDICIGGRGANNIYKNLIIDGCQSHGIDLGESYSIIENVTVRNSTLANKNRNMSSGWGSGIKVSFGGNNITINNSKAYNNFGEGIAITRGSNITLTNSIFYDNYSANIYIDNSKDILVDNNFSYNTGNTAYYRSNKSAGGIVIGEEYYSGWGAQLARITVTNNIVLNTDKGFMYWGADSQVSSQAGLDNVKVMHNTFWGITSSRIYLASQPKKARNSVISNNIFGGTGGWVEDLTGVTFRNNLWNTLPSSDSKTRGLNDRVESNPFLTSPSASSKASVALKSSSLAVNKGYNESILKDAFGTNRPQGSGFDIGAYEFSDGSVPPVTPPSTSPITLKINIIEDTYARIDYPTTIFGQSLNLVSDSSPLTLTYLKLDLTSLENKNINSAYLKIYVNNSASGLSHYIYSLNNSNWSEGSLSYYNRPSLVTKLGEFKGKSAGYWLTIDLKSIVTSKKGTVTSIAIKSPNSDAIGFSSSESSTSTLKPYLNVTYTN